MVIDGSRLARNAWLFPSKMGVLFPSFLVLSQQNGTVGSGFWFPYRNRGTVGAGKVFQQKS